MVTLLGFSTTALRYSADDTVRISATYSDAVTLTTNGVAPLLSLSNGAKAVYAGTNGTDTLYFDYVVTANDNATADLSVSAFALNDATLTDLNGAAVDTTIISYSATTPAAVNNAIDLAINGVTSDAAIAIATAVISSEDLVAPKVASVSADSGQFSAGDTVTIRLSFDEVVLVKADQGVPTLSLTSNGVPVSGAVASYVSGSGTKTLTFNYTVQAGVNIADLDLGAIALNGGVISDFTGNLANLSVPALPATTQISVGTVSTTTYTSSGSTNTETEVETLAIESVRFNGDDSVAFKVGEVVTLRVNCSDAVNLDTSAGAPKLVLNNGGFATYESGAGTNSLVFSYVVAASDRNTQDLGVLGVADNDAIFTGIAGNDVDLRINSSNNLNLFNDVAINAQSPFVRSIDAQNQSLAIGESVEFIVNFSEAIELSGDAPTLTLSNGGVAEYVSGSTTSSFLFRYTVAEADDASADLNVVSLNTLNSTLTSLSGNGEASISLANTTQVSARYDISVDSQRPEGTIEIDMDALHAGQTANVTVTFAEPVSNPFAAITVSNGVLSQLVTDETETPRTVWKGVFTPSVGIEDPETTLVLDNSLVTDDAGNTGVTLSVSNPIEIDTLGPVANITSGVTAAGNRLYTIDFGEQVNGLEATDLVTTNGIRVVGSFQEIEAGQVYQVEVAPGTSGATGEVSLTLKKGAVTDSLGNSNAEFKVTTGWDIIAPEIQSVSAAEGSYTTGDTIAIQVQYDEVVNVDTTNGVPFLALSNGQMATYTAGSQSNTLVFEYTVQRGDEAPSLDVLALVKDGATIVDNAGNSAKTLISYSNGLAHNSAIEVDGVAPSIVTMSSESGLYLAGDTVTIEVQFSEAVYVDTSKGSPILALNNGAVATYVPQTDESGAVITGTPYLTFEYQVQEGQFDSIDLDVNALAENGAVLKDISGNNANVAIRSELNTLAYRSDVTIDTAQPKINTISANAGDYKAGDVLDIALGWNKPVVMDDSMGTPDLMLSNGSIAVYNPAASTPTRMVFSYTITNNDTETETLTIAEFRPHFSTYSGLVAGVEADLTLPNNGAIAQADGGVTVDLTLPEVKSITVADAVLAAGEITTVTVVTTEAVKTLKPEFFNVANGTLSQFTTADNITWTATFKPTKDTQIDGQTITLNQAYLADAADNFGTGTATSNEYALDSVYPTVSIRTDANGVTNGPVRVIVNFSEEVLLNGAEITADDFGWIKVENATIDTLSLETPRDGRPMGEYSFIVTPKANSDAPIKVRVPDSAVTDLNGNANKQSDVLVQAADTVKAKIESIHAQAGAYAVGDTVSIEVEFTEKVSFEAINNRLPTLFLNNGKEAQYKSGAGSQTLVFEYTFGEGDAVQNPLQVLAFLEQDVKLVDLAGNSVKTGLNASNRLSDTIIIDGDAPVVSSFTAVEGNYNSESVIWIKLHSSEWVTVTTATGRPTLELSNGGQALYVSGSGSDTLLFRYDVNGTDASVSELHVDTIAMNGGSIVDVAGNLMDGSALSITRVDGETVHTNAVSIDNDAPTVVNVVIAEDAGSNNDVANDGYYQAGTTVAFDVNFDEALSLDLTNGSPVLTLSNGQFAHYIEARSDLANGVMRFEYTVNESHINREYLKVWGMAEQGAVIKDSAGNDAIVDIAADQLAYETLVTDTKDPIVDMAVSFNNDAEVLTTLEETMTVTLNFNEPLDFASVGVDSFVIGAVADGELADNMGNISLALGGEAVAEVVPGSFTLVDAQTVTVELKVNDLYRGDVRITLAEGGLRDMAGNVVAEMPELIQAVDTITTSFDITPVAGPFVGSEATVKLFAADGTELTAGEDYRVDYSTETQDGKVQVTLLNGYRGPMLIEVNDTSETSTDYTDELTKQQVSLDTALRTMIVVDQPAPESAPIPVIVSPLTELAVRKAGYAEGTIPTDLSEGAVAYNAKVADLFGLTNVDITKTPVTTTLEAVFNEADGLSDSEAYGKVLATLSVKDSETGSVRNTIEGLVNEISEEADSETQTTKLNFTASAALELERATNVVDLMQDTSDETTGADALAVANALKAVIRTAAGEEPFVTQDELTLLGVQGVDDNTIGLALRLLKQTADDGSQVDTVAKIDELLSAALTALKTIADAAGTDSAATDVTHDQYAALGYDYLTPEFEASLAKVFDLTTISTEEANTVAEIEAIIATYENLFAYVADPTTADHVPTEADYARLGLTGVSEQTLVVLNDALATDATLSASIEDVNVLQQLIDDFNGSMDAIRLYSEDPIANADQIPTLGTFQKLRLANIDETLVDSINSVLADSDIVLSVDGVRNEAQTIINTYNSLLSFNAQDADAVAPTSDDYAALGVTQLTDTRAVDVASSLITNKTVDQIDSAAELEAIADAINALLYTVDLEDASTAVTDENAITVEQLSLLNQTVTQAQLASLRAFMATKADTDVANLTELTHLVDAVVTAAERIKAFSEDPTAAMDVINGGLGEPTELDYEIVLAGTGTTIADLAAMNEILADSDVVVGETDLQSELNSVVSIYNVLYGMADGGSINEVDALSLTDYQTLGINDLDTTDSNDLSTSFLNSVMDVQSSEGIDTAAELQALSNAVIALRDTVANGLEATNGITVDQLILLGVADATDANLTALQTVIARDAIESYNNFATLADLQSVATNVFTALNTLSAHTALDADAANNPSEAVYAQAGVAGVTEDNLLAVNAQVRLADTAEAKDSLEELTALVEAADAAIEYIRTTVAPEIRAVIELADAETGLTLEEQLAAYSAAGVTDVTEANLLAVNAQVRLVVDIAGKDSVSELQSLVTLADEALVYLTTVAVETDYENITQEAQLAAYSAAGVLGVTADNLLAVNAQMRAAENKATVAEGQATVTAADAALARIEAHAEGDDALAITDYEAVGVLTVTDENLLAVNAQVVRAEDLAADSVEEIAGLVDAANNAMAFILTDIAPLTSTETPDATAQIEAYNAAGITGVTEDNLLAVNAQIRKQLAADAELDTPTENLDSVAELQGKVTAANDAIAYLDSTVAPNTDYVTLTQAEQATAYHEAGVLSVTVDNVLAVNAQMRLETTAENKDAVAEIETIVGLANDAIAYLSTTVASEITAPATLADGESGIALADQLAAYSSAGITGVTEGNILAVNAQMRLVTDGTLKDSVDELQALVTDANNAITYLATVAAEENFITISEADQLAAYSAAGIQGVGADNLLAVNAQFRVATDKASVDQIQLTVTAANTELAQVEDFADGDTALAATDYSDVGVTGVSADNLAAVNAQVLLAADGSADSVAEIQDIVTDANNALAYIVSNTAPLTATGSTDAATQIAAYEAAGITGVTEDNLLAVNAQIRKQLAADSDATTNLDTVADIQGKVTAANDAIAYLNTIVAPEVDYDSIPVEDQVATYADAGVLNVSVDNVLAVNAQMRLESTPGNKDSVAEIQTIVSFADEAIDLIEEYNNGDGSTTLANGAISLTAEDYAAAGIQGVTSANIVAVNQIVLAANSGDTTTVNATQNLVDKGLQAQLDAMAKIADYADPLVVSSQATAGDAATKAVQTIDPGALTEGDGYTLHLGTVTLESGAFETALSVTDLISALQADGAYNLAPFTLSEDAGLIKIEFKNYGERTTLGELHTARPTVADFVKAGVTGLADNQLYAAIDLLEKRAPDQVDQLTEIQTVATNAATVQTNNLNVVLNYAIDNANTKPTVMTYKLAGLTAVTELTLPAINKLIALEDSNTVYDFDTAAAIVNAGVQAYTDALLKIANHANELADAPVPTLEDYETAGITGLIADDIDMINALIIQRESAEDGIATTSSGIQSVVNAGLAAVFKLRDAAENDTAIGNLVEADYTAVGIDAADIPDVGALNSSLDSQPVNGVIARIYSTLSNVVTAVKKLLGIADGTDDNASETMTADDLIAMGLTGLEATTGESAKQTAAIAIFNDLADTKANADVDTVGETQALYNAVQAALRTAMGETPKITKDQLKLLGFDVDNADSNVLTDVTDNNLTAIQQVLINLAIDTDFSALTDLASLETLVNDAIAAMNTLAAAAEGNDAAAITDATTLADMGVDTVTDFAAINTVLELATITSAQVSTYEQVKALVDSYNLILEMADSGIGDAEAQDYANIGITGVTTADQVVLVNSFIKAKNDSTLIDDVNDLQDQASALTTILALSETAEVEGIDNSTAATLGLTDLENLGFNIAPETPAVSGTEISVLNIDSIRLAIANTADDHSDITDFTALETLINETATSANVIQAYAASGTSQTPALDDYLSIGVIDVTDKNLAGVNGSLAQSGVLDSISASVAKEVQDIVDVWTQLADLADASNNVATTDTATKLDATAYAALGVTLASGIEDQVASLLSDYLDPKAFSEADTVTDLQAYADAVAALITTSAMSYDATTQTDAGTGVRVDGSNTYISLAQLQLLGFGVVNDDARDGTYAASTRYDDALNFITGSTVGTDFDTYKASLIGALNGLSELEKAAVLNNADETTAGSAVYEPLGLTGEGAETYLTSTFTGKELYPGATGSWSNLDFGGSSNLGMAIQAINGTTLNTSVTFKNYKVLSVSSTSAEVAFYNSYYSVYQWQKYTFTESGATYAGMGMSSSLETIGTTNVDWQHNGSSSANVYLPTGVDIFDFKTTAPTAYSSVNTVLNTDAVDSVDLSSLQSTVTNYESILAAADSGSTDSGLALTAANYIAMGITGLQDSARGTALVALVNSIIESLATTAVDDIAEVQAIFNAAEALLTTVEGKTPQITQAELTTLGFTNVTTDNLSAVLKVLSDLGITSDYTSVDELSEIKTIIDGVVNGLIAISTAAENDSAAFADATTFAAVGVENVDGANVGLINSILNGSVDGPATNTLEEVQKLVDIANKVIALAGDDSKAKLTQAELALIGVTDMNTDAEVALLNDLIVADSTAQTTVAEIQTFADAASKVLVNAALETTATFDDTNALTATELETLGFTNDTNSPRTLTANGVASDSVNAENLGLIRLAIANTANDYSGVNRLTKLTTVVTDVATAANKLVNFAESVSTPTDAALIPTVADFEAFFVTGVDSTNLASVLDVLAQSNVTVSGDIQAKVQAVVNSYNLILTAADATDNNSVSIAESDLINLDVDLSTDATVKAAQVTLLNDLIDTRAASDVDTNAELQTLAGNVKDLLDTAMLAEGTDVTTQGVSVAQLNALGFSGANDNNIVAIRQALINTRDDLSGVDSYADLQLLLNNVINALEILANYAADETSTAPNVQTWNYATFSEVTGDNFEAMQIALIDAIRSEADTTDKLQLVVNKGLQIQQDAISKIAAYSNAIASSTIENAGSNAITSGAPADATPRHLSMDLTGKLDTAAFTLRVGTYTLTTAALTTADAATLVAELTTSAGYATLPFEVRAEGETLHIEWKAWGANSATATLRTEQPSLDDYLISGVQFRTNDGVDADNLYAVNKAIEEASLATTVDADNVTTVIAAIETELETSGQGLDAQTAALAVIEAYADGGSTAPSVEDYKLAQVMGVTEDNLLAVNAQLVALNTDPNTTHTVADIEAAVAAANAKLAAFEANTPADPGVGFTVADYEAIGVVGVVSDDVVNGTDNLAAVNAQVALAADEDANRVLDIALLIGKANAAFEVIEAYNNGSLDRELTVDDYVAAGVLGVTELNIHAVNNEVAFDAAVLASTSQIQSLANAGFDAYAAAQSLVGDYLSDPNIHLAMSATAVSFVPLIKDNNDPDAAGIVELNMDGASTPSFDAYKVFDADTSTADNSGAHSATALTVDTGTYIGWKDPSVNAQPVIFDSVSFIERVGYGERMPGAFDVEGWNPTLNSGAGGWELIGSFVNTTQGSFDLNASNLTLPVSTLTYQSYQLPAEPVHTGFRFNVETTANMENGGGNAALNINQITINVLTETDSPYVPSIEDLQTAGVIGLDAGNYQAVLRYIDLMTEATDTATLVSEINALIPAFNGEGVAATGYSDDVSYNTGDFAISVATDDQQPVLSGQVSATDGLTSPRVKVSVDGTYLGDATLAEDGSWTFAVTADIAEGAHTVRAELVDGGNGATGGTVILGAVSEQTLTIDITAPAMVATTLALAEADDSGRSVTDLTTNISVSELQLTAGMIADDVAAIRIYLNDTYVAGSYDNDTGIFTADTSLAEGTYEFTYTVLDASGNESAPSAVISTIVVDKTAPDDAVVALQTDTGVSDSDNLTSDPNIVISNVEAGADVAYRFDSTDAWTTLTGDTITVTEGGLRSDRPTPYFQSTTIGDISNSGSFNVSGVSVLPVTVYLDFTLPSTLDAVNRILFELGGDSSGISVMANGEDIIVYAGSNENFVTATGALQAGERNLVMVEIQADSIVNIHHTVVDLDTDYNDPTYQGQNIDDLDLVASQLVDLGGNLTGSDDGGWAKESSTGYTKGAEGGDFYTTGSFNYGAIWANQVKADIWQSGTQDQVIEVQVTDAAGNATVSMLDYSVDTLMPTLSGISLAVDSGASSSDNITNSGLVQVEGLSTGDTWQVSIDGGNTWTDGDTLTNSFTLPEGEYGVGQVIVQSLDLAGNTARAEMGAVTVDLTENAPNIQISLDANTAHEFVDFSVANPETGGAVYQVNDNVATITTATSIAPLQEGLIVGTTTRDGTGFSTSYDPVNHETAWADDGTDYFYLDITMPDTFDPADTSEHVIFEVGGDGNGTTLFHEGSTLGLYIGGSPANDADTRKLDLANAVEAGVRYQIILAVRPGDRDWYLYLGERSDTQETMDLKLIGSGTNWDGDATWSGGDAWGFGKVSSAAQGQDQENYTDFQGDINQWYMWEDTASGIAPWDLIGDASMSFAMNKVAQKQLLQAGQTDLAGNYALRDEFSIDFVGNDFTVSLTDGATAPTLVELNGAVPNRIFINNLPEEGWQYSLDGGSTWLDSRGDNIILPNGTYPADAIQVRLAAGSEVALNLQEITIDLPYVASDFTDLIVGFAEGVTSYTPAYSDYASAGYDLTPQEQSFANAFLTAQDFSSENPVSDLAVVIFDLQTLYAKFNAYLVNNGSTDAPTLADYAAFGIDVPSTNIDAINAVLRGETVQLDSFTELQSIVDTGVAQYEALITRIQSFEADGIDRSSTFLFVPDTGDGVNDTNDRAGLTMTSVYGTYDAWKLFDQGASSDSSLYATGNGTPSPHTLGWFDSTGEYPMGVLESISWTARSGYTSRVPGEFSVQGWNGSEWEVIQTFNNTTSGSRAFQIDSNLAYSGFQIVATSTLSGDRIDLWEMEFNTYQVLELTAAEWNTLGLSLIDADNVSAFNAFARDSGICDKAGNMDAIIGNIEPMFELSQAIKANNPSLTNAEMSGINQMLTKLVEFTGAGLDNFLPQSVLGGEVSDVQELLNNYATMSPEAKTDLQNYLIALDKFNDYLAPGSYQFVPVLTDYTSASGTAAAGSEYDTHHLAWMAFDNNPTTIWAARDGITDDTIEWINSGDQVPGYLTSVSIQARQESGNVKQSPQNFTVEGYDADTATWVEIESFSSATFTAGQTQSFALTSDVAQQAFSGFRLHATSTQGLDPVSLAQLDFVVSNNPSPMAAADLAILGFDATDAASAMAVTTALAGYAQTSTATTLADMLIEARAAASEILSTVVAMETTDEYDAQVATGVEVTADALNELLGEDYFVDGDTTAIDEAVARLIALEDVPAAGYELNQVLTSDAYISSIMAGADGSETAYTGISVQDATPDLIIDLVDVAAGDTVQLVIDGIEVDLGAPTADQLAAGQMVLDNRYLPINDAGSDKEVTLAVKVTHTDNSEVTSDEWTYNWQ